MSDNFLIAPPISSATFLYLMNILVWRNINYILFHISDNNSSSQPQNFPLLSFSVCFVGARPRCHSIRHRFHHTQHYPRLPFSNLLRRLRCILPRQAPLCHHLDYHCDNILSGYLCAVTTVFSQQDGIYGFKFPKRFLEISSRDLTLFSTLLSILI